MSIIHKKDNEVNMNNLKIEKIDNKDVESYVLLNLHKYNQQHYLYDYHIRLEIIFLNLLT